MPITIIPGAEGFTSLELFQRAAEFAGLTLPSSDTVAVVPIGEVEGVRYYISFAVSDDGAGIILQPCFAGAGGGKGVVYVWPNIKKHFGETTTVVQQALKKRTLIMRWNALGLDQPRTLDNLFENRFNPSMRKAVAANAAFSRLCSPVIFSFQSCGRGGGTRGATGGCACWILESMEGPTTSLSPLF